MTAPSTPGSPPEQGPERSAPLNAAVSWSSILVPDSKKAQLGSIGRPRDADLAAQLKRPVVALAAAVSFDASHRLGTSGRLARTVDTQKSTLWSQVAAALPHSPAFANAAVYLASTLAVQSLSPEESPVLATFARHASLPLSFF